MISGVGLINWQVEDRSLASDDRLPEMAEGLEPVFIELEGRAADRVDVAA